PGPLESAQAAGDQHAGGRRVVLLRFRSGDRLVYKPRSLKVDMHFQELLAFINGLESEAPFRTLAVLDRGPYGWMEFVPARPCEDEGQVHRFYQRQGGYLALLYVLAATDFHFENLIACGEHPVLIDLESLFHPRVGGKTTQASEDAAFQAIDESVLRVGMLPQRLWGGRDAVGIDISGLGGAPGQLAPTASPTFEGAGTDEMRFARQRLAISGSQNRPSLRGADVDVAQHAEALAAGFDRVYGILKDHREAFLAKDGPIHRFANDEVRAILRSTRTYALLLQESFHPDVLRDALDRDCLFDRLWLAAEELTHLQRLFPLERDDLWQNDIPIFTTRPGAVDLWNSRGERLEGFLAQSSLDLVVRRFSELSDDDRSRQSWFVRASLGTLVMGESDASWRGYPPTPARRAHAASDFLEAARRIGDRLDTLALAGPSKADAIWLGLRLLENGQWSLLPSDIDLYSGVPGIALFLGYLGEVTGEPRYTQLARAGVETLGRLVVRAKGHLEHVGAFNGWGGVIYTMAHLGTLWGDGALLDQAGALVEQLPALIDKDSQFDVVSGLAGCIGAVLALDQVRPREATRAAVVRAGLRLARHVMTHSRGPHVGSTPFLAGFSHGAAGMAWALMEIYGTSGDRQFADAALAALELERRFFSPENDNWRDLRNLGAQRRVEFPCAWCHGAPGIGLARLRALKWRDDHETREEIQAALRATMAQGFGGNHSLCHGDWGNIELITHGARVLGDKALSHDGQGLAGMLLESSEQHGWISGVPHGVETPGLMTGLAGIGYGLLRIACPDAVPSVLLLEAPRTKVVA
ncbi:MAG: type 2 lantipeptide synthetase LanM, partial [Deltaproteobacteria bacterium]|nr:type 2 lantipeptide synthetase LanM [Deltaproteobacteria bacterium]